MICLNCNKEYEGNDNTPSWCIECRHRSTVKQLDDIIEENHKLLNIAKRIVQANKCNFHDDVSQKVEQIAYDAEILIKERELSDKPTEGNE